MTAIGFKASLMALFSLYQEDLSCFDSTSFQQRLSEGKHCSSPWSFP